MNSLIQFTGGYQRFSYVHLLAFFLTPVTCHVGIVQIHFYDQWLLKGGKQFCICETISNYITFHVEITRVCYGIPWVFEESIFARYSRGCPLTWTSDCPVPQTCRGPKGCLALAEEEIYMKNVNIWRILSFYLTVKCRYMNRLTNYPLDGSVTKVSVVEVATKER